MRDGRRRLKLAWRAAPRGASARCTKETPAVDAPSVKRRPTPAAPPPNAKSSSQSSPTFVSATSSSPRHRGHSSRTVPACPDDAWRSSCRFARRFPNTCCSPSCSSSHSQSSCVCPGRRAWAMSPCATHGMTSVVAHDQSTHRTLAEEPLHRAGLVRRPRRLGLVGARRDADRCDSGPLGQPGHRLHGLAGSQPAGGGRPGQLSADGEPAGPRRRSRRPLAVGVRLLDDLRRLRRQHRPVLRARPRPGAHEPRHEEPAGRRRADAGPGRDGRRARLLVHAWKAPRCRCATCAACRTGSFAIS